MGRTAQTRIARLAALACLLVTSTCLAQTGLRTLSGIVTDRQKEPLKGAVVQVQDEVTNSVVSYITLADGSFSFKRLSSNNDYWVTARYHGKRSKRKELSRYNANTHPTITLILNPH